MKTETLKKANELSNKIKNTERHREITVDSDWISISNIDVSPEVFKELKQYVLHELDKQIKKSQKEFDEL